jgi:hypothetical protein
MYLVKLDQFRFFMALSKLPTGLMEISAVKN